MTENMITLKEKKLKNIRKILSICFFGFLACILVFTLPFSIIVNRGELMDVGEGMIIPVWPLFVISQLLGIVLFGGICMIIYYIFKYRADRVEEDLFL